MALPEEVEKALSAMFAGVGAGAGAAARGVRKASSRAVRETAKSPTAEQLQQFEDQHATPFDPDSSMDRGKMLKIMAAREPKGYAESQAEHAASIPAETVEQYQEKKAAREAKPKSYAEAQAEHAASIPAETVEQYQEKKAAREAGASPELLESLFRTTHGGSFDPKSSTDKKKMEQIKELLGSGEDFGDLSDRKMRNRFALKVYRNYDYV